MYSILRDLIYNQIKTVSNVGVVHNRIRFHAQLSTLLDNFKTIINGVDTLQGFMVTWDSMPSGDGEWGAIPGTFGDTYRYKIIGLRVFSDIINTGNNNGSETEFFPIVENVLNALRSLEVTTIVGDVGYSLTAVLNTTDLRMYASRLFHYVEIMVEVKVQTTVTYV